MKEAEFNTYSIYQKSERKKVKEMKWFNLRRRWRKWNGETVRGRKWNGETDGGGEGNEMVKPTLRGGEGSVALFLNWES